MLHKALSSDLHSSYRPASGLDSESAWRSSTQQLPSLSPPYWLCTLVEDTKLESMENDKKVEKKMHNKMHRITLNYNRYNMLSRVD